MAKQVSRRLFKTLQNQRRNEVFGSSQRMCSRQPFFDDCLDCHGGSNGSMSVGEEQTLVNKSSFLAARNCKTKGWFTRREKDCASSGDESLRLRNGIEVGRRARDLFADGVLIDERNLNESLSKTKTLMADPSVRVLFEASFVSGSCVAKPDVIKREGDGWHIIEVKSGTKPKQKYTEDVTFTTAVVKRSGTDVVRSSLFLVSRDFRLGMPDQDFFHTVDISKEVNELRRDFDDFLEVAAENVLSETDCRPSPEFSLHCRNCRFWEDCLGKRFRHPITELPRLSADSFDALVSVGAQEISDIPDDSVLTPRQSIVWQSILSREPVIDRKLATEMLEAVEFPAFYLDFETASSAFPLYPSVAPYEQILTQFSVHKCVSPGRIVDHKEFLANTASDSRLELAEVLLKTLGEEGSIVVYSGFEKRMITDLAKRFPQLGESLLALNNRLFDLEKVFLKAFYHPLFRGKTSIKSTLPALVDMRYDELEVSDGESAAAAFISLARGNVQDVAELDKIRQHLFQYCALDTEAMVALHQRVLEMVIK